MNVARCAVFLLGVTACSAAQNYKILYSFGGQLPDGAGPTGDIISDQVGNVYGTTQFGDASDDGAVFQLTKNNDGSWSEQTLYSFCSSANCSDGYDPLAGLVMDRQGNLYGTTSLGGGSPECGCGGTVFELSPPSVQGQAWSYNVIYNFCQSFSGGICEDGSDSSAQLVFDSSGNLFGTTQAGGTVGLGTVFELSPTESGWSESVLHSFCGGGAKRGLPRWVCAVCRSDFRQVRQFIWNYTTGGQ
jgi:uncharacterized repeat protein (TIGR03803 family)